MKILFDVNMAKALAELNTLFGVTIPEPSDLKPNSDNFSVGFKNLLSFYVT